MEEIAAENNIRVLKDVRVPLRDGITLAADLYMPNTPGKFPAVITCYPYHKDGLIGKVYHVEEPTAFARRGYVYVFLDMRGTGGSEGCQPEAMRFQQWEDGYDAVEWISTQPWCNGNVGMCGHSYGGYVSINVATLDPPHLKAIAPVQADVTWSCLTHPGGAPRCLATNMWCALMIGMNFMPPLYTDDANNWVEIWNYHLEHNKEWLFSLYEHPTEDAFMREGAALTRLDKIKAATYFMGGFRDVFPEGPFVLYNSIKAPKKILMGPWKHSMPDKAIPGPNIDYLNEWFRWFDYWLKGIENNIMNEPPITIRVQGHNSKWRCENEWPVARRKETVFYLHSGNTLESRPYEGECESDSFEHNATVGTARGLEEPIELPLGLPLDQRGDEALSLTYTTEPMPEDTEITGAPMMKLFASTSADVGVFVAKLNDIAPDGRSTSITYGCLNVEQRESREKILPIKPGEVYQLPVELCSTSYVVKAGHRLRLAIASSDFPFIWPTPKAAENTVYHSRKYPSQITIPFIPRQKTSLPEPVLREVSPPTHLPSHIEYSRPYWNISYDPVTSTITVCTGTEDKIILDAKTTLEFILHAKTSASSADPANAKAITVCQFNIEGHKLGTVNVKVNLETTRESGNAIINLLINGLLAFSKRWIRS